MTPQINAIIAAERHTDTLRALAHSASPRARRQHRLSLRPPRLAPEPVALQCCA